MTDHAKYVALATRLIDKHGRTVGVYQIGSTASGPFPTPSESLLVQQKAVFVPASGSDLGLEWIDEQMLKRVSQVCLMAGSDVDCQLATHIKDAASSFKVAWVQVLYPGDTLILYAFGLTR